MNQNVELTSDSERRLPICRLDLMVVHLKLVVLEEVGVVDVEPEH